MSKNATKKVSLRNAKEYETNPFIVHLKDKMYIQPRANSIIAKGQALIDTESGEVIDEAVLIGKRKYVDKSQFAKLYASEIAILYELTKAAQNVFLYLSKVMDYDNRAYFNYNKEYKKLGYKTHFSCLKGIKELIKENIIACDVREHHYWLNPTIICKGERFAKYTEYIVDNRMKLGEAKVKQQAKDNFIDMDQEVRDKIDRANKSKQNSLFDSQNENPYQ